ncbi:unnamed protein product [Psylliodes chrysocephalus]|uniref:HAT C-terminal dimerisation domain-containing protein n=1 Tax=Psylliodes chrysocephalus TaxID=3402493 RepID=A0A9P0D436_9CUCU|nr:unnamed protein product [Psylliodes chrysocephala]
MINAVLPENSNSDHLGNQVPTTADDSNIGMAGTSRPDVKQVTDHFDDQVPTTSNDINIAMAGISRSDVEQAHTSVKLTSELKKVVFEWALENKILLAVTDNAANITKAIKDNLKRKHLGCYAHTINLIAKDAITVVEDLIAKIRKLVAHFKRSTSASAKLLDVQRQSGKTPKKLLQDVSTRWNSTYYMVEKILDLEEAVRTTMALLDKANLPIIFVEEWHILKDIKIGLEPLETITKNIMLELKKQDLCALPPTMVSKMLNSIKERLRDLENSKTLAVSTFPDRRFKHVGFSNESVAQRTKQMFLNLVANKIKNETTINNQDDEIDGAVPSTSTQIDLKKMSIWSHFEKKAASFQPSGTSSSRGIVEVQRYLEDELLARDSDPLKWWQKYAYNYPHLSKVKN